LFLRKEDIGEKRGDFRHGAGQFLKKLQDGDRRGIQKMCIPGKRTEDYGLVFVPLDEEALSGPKE